MTYRPRHVRQMDALPDWLAKSVWEARQAACLLAGVLPSPKDDFSPPTTADRAEFGSWLHEACLPLLPDELLLVPSPEKPLQIANRKKARIRWDSDDKHVVLRDAGRAEFERLRAQDFDGYKKKDGSVIIIRVALAVLEAVKVAEPDPEFHSSPRTAERHVKKWLELDRSDNAPALSDTAGVQVAK